DPVRLLALAKHPFAAFGMAPAECRDAARALELALFRGHRVRGGAAKLPEALARSRETLATDKHAAPARRRLQPWQWERAARLADAMAACLTPLEASGEISAAASAGLLTEALVRAATDNRGEAPLWQGPAGAALARLLEDIVEDAAASLLL